MGHNALMTPDLLCQPNPSGLYRWWLAAGTAAPPPEYLMECDAAMRRMTAGEAAGPIVTCVEDDADGYVVAAVQWTLEPSLSVRQEAAIYGALGEAVALSRLATRR